MAIRKVITKYKWRINNFSQQIAIVEGGGSISSDAFSLNGNSNEEFSMKLEHSGTDECDVYLVCNDFGHKKEMQLDVKTWCECIKGKIEHEWTFSKASGFNLLCVCYKLSDIKEVVGDSVFTFYCEIKHEESIGEFDENDSEKKDLIAHREFNRKLFALHSKGKLDSTVTIQAGGREFKASKLALMACSDVFNRMFLCESSTEAKTGIVRIGDIKPETIDALIHWVYQIEVDNIEDIAIDLYRAADKYNIGFLKNKCIEIMTKSLSTENLASRLILAYKFNEEQFKKDIFSFFDGDNKSWKRLVASDEWMELCSEDSEEAKSILAEIPD